MLSGSGAGGLEIVQHSMQIRTFRTARQHSPGSRSTPIRKLTRYLRANIYEQLRPII